MVKVREASVKKYFADVNQACQKYIKLQSYMLNVRVYKLLIIYSKQDAML